MRICALETIPPRWHSTKRITESSTVQSTEGWSRFLQRGSVAYYAREATECVHGGGMNNFIPELKLNTISPGLRSSALKKKYSSLSRTTENLRSPWNNCPPASYTIVTLACLYNFWSHRTSPKWAVSVKDSMDSSGNSLSVNPGIAPSADGPSKTPAITCQTPKTWNVPINI